MPAKLPNQIGLRYGRWLVQSYGKEIGYTKHVVCVCDCGVSKEVAIGSLRNGDSTSCGCLSKEDSATRLRTHGLRFHPLYGVFQNIKNRCNRMSDRRYSDYGGRGIKCLWESFEEFYADMHASYKKGLQIDRIDNNGNYSKENCRWVTPKENSRNRRNTIMTTEMMSECERRGIKCSTVRQRMRKYGMSWEEAINKNTR